jgi:hypothetical protein
MCLVASVYAVDWNTNEASTSKSATTTATATATELLFVGFHQSHLMLFLSKKCTRCVHRLIAYIATTFLFLLNLPAVRIFLLRKDKQPDTIGHGNMI